MRNTIFKSYVKKILRSEAFVSVAIVFVLALGIIGTSYALYMDVDSDTDYQLVEVGDLKIDFDNKDNSTNPGDYSKIELFNMLPMDDSKGITQSDNIFSFRIYNTGTYAVDYDIKLVTADGNEIDTKYINYQLCKESADNCQDITTLSNVTDSIIKTDQIIAPNTGDDASHFYFLRIWINNSYPEELWMSDNAIVLRVLIEAKYTSGHYNNEHTLAGAILNNDNITVNYNTPVITGIADYKVTGDATSGELGLFRAEDDYGMSYYFRGAQSYNYVKFAGFTWRVVRINGDGTIRLVLDKSLGINSECTNADVCISGSVFNDMSKDDHSYAGYMGGLFNTTTHEERCLKLIDNVVTNIKTDNEYNTKEFCESEDGKWTTTAYEATQANVKNSKIKDKVDAFYEYYLLNKYDKYIADRVFCADKTMAPTTIAQYNSGKGYGISQSYYGITGRLYYTDRNNTKITVATPTFKCAYNEENNNGSGNIYSRYTVKEQTLKNGSITNGDLIYPIALLTTDEVAYAGAFFSVGNTNYYLYNKSIPFHYFTMTPFNVSFNSGVENDGKIRWLSNKNPYSVRPVINLKEDVIVSSGDGSESNPYQIEYN